ncbi:MAG: glycosyltransferase family 2 protein [Jannaschia sp.]
MSARTTIVTVTYNSAAVVGQMLRSLPTDAVVVVVDNASTDDTCARVEADLPPHGRLVAALRNEGFGRACNRGAMGAETEFLLFLNPDARLEPGALEALEEEADRRPDLGAANPSIETANGRARLKMTSVLPVERMPRPAPETAGRMPVLSGGVLFVRRAAFEAVGGFDPAIFLYHEDHELCWRLAQAGHELWHLPQARAVHIMGTGTARSPEAARWKGFHMARSRYYVVEKATPGQGFRRSFWPALLSLLSPVNFLSNRRRQKSIGQISGAVSARKDGGVYRPQ